MKLRYRIGLWFLRPFLLREYEGTKHCLEIATGNHDFYWSGRLTAIDRVLRGRLQ
jgi:hypothetical protein